MSPRVPERVCPRTPDGSARWVRKKKKKRKKEKKKKRKKEKEKARALLPGLQQHTPVFS
jgi:hypothetical protein